jgi:hypothetical protein
VKPGDQIMVKVIEIDSQGRINLSRKAVLGGGEGSPAESHDGAPSRNGAPRPERTAPPAGGGGDRGDRGDRRPRRRPRPE